MTSPSEKLYYYPSEPEPSSMLLCFLQAILVFTERIQKKVYRWRHLLLQVFAWNKNSKMLHNLHQNTASNQINEQNYFESSLKYNYYERNVM